MATAAETEENTTILNRAHLYFCAMVMRVIEIGEAGEGVGDFEDAVSALNDGAITREIPILLGLRFNVGPAWASTNGQSGVVAWRGGHAVFAAHGVYDRYGESHKIRSQYPRRLFLA